MQATVSTFPSIVQDFLTKFEARFAQCAYGNFKQGYRVWSFAEFRFRTQPRNYEVYDGSGRVQHETKQKEDSVLFPRSISYTLAESSLSS